jgi:glycosyltransferase involved in cell wall biosynthesis
MSQISVIVPVYKVEKYLRRCLDSVLLQTYTDYECILVDDASPDSCPAICNEYAKKDPRFKVIHKQKNEGLPKARKSGLDMAITDFVMHVDSDDWIERNAIELLYKKQMETNADIVIGNIKAIFVNYAKKLSYIPIKNNEDVTEWFILCEHKSLCGKLYRKTFFNDYIIPETNIYEDAIVNVQLFSKLANNKIQFIVEVIYNYDNTNSSSLISQMKKKYLNSYTEQPLIHSLMWIGDYIKEVIHENNDKIDSAFKYYFLLEGIIPYITRKNKINKDEVILIYKNYYKNCSHLKLLKPYKRIIIPLYRFSMLTGNMYMFVYNVFFGLRAFLDYKTTRETTE